MQTTSILGGERVRPNKILVPCATAIMNLIELPCGQISAKLDK